MVPARAAYSHSASVGSRPPTAAQYLFAAAQDMPLSQVLLPGEAWRPVEGLEGTPGVLLGDPSGNLYVADAEKPVIRRLGTDGRVYLDRMEGMRTLSFIKEFEDHVHRHEK